MEINEWTLTCKKMEIDFEAKIEQMKKDEKRRREKEANARCPCPVKRHNCGCIVNKSLYIKQKSTSALYNK